jgi:hypothetical protein
MFKTHFGILPRFRVSSCSAPLVVPNYDSITYTILIEFKERKDNPSPFRRGAAGLGMVGLWGFGVWVF